MYHSISASQSRIIIESTQVFEAYLESKRKAETYKGTMRWKKTAGKEYLFRAIDRYGNGRTLGRRTPATEKTLANFIMQKYESQERLASLKEELRKQAGHCKVEKVNRLPTIVSKILKMLGKYKLSEKMMVVGTNALYAYEMAAGVYFSPRITSTNDIDLLFDSRSNLKIIVNEKIDSLLNILKKVDPTFERSSMTFKAVNKSGFSVDLIKPEPKPPWKNEIEIIGDSTDDLIAVPIRSQHWLVSSPKMRQVVFCYDGQPVKMTVPDPRAFSIHKIWLSNSKERDPMKKYRDRLQSIEVARLIMDKLPQFDFNEEMRMFPKEIYENAKAELMKHKERVYIKG